MWLRGERHNPEATLPLESNVRVLLVQNEWYWQCLPAR